MAISNMTAMNNSYSNVMNTADMIPDSSPWTILAKAGIKGVATGIQTSAQKKELKLQEMGFRAKAQTARINAKFQKESTRQAMRNMFASYREGDNQAMVQGIRDRERLGQQRASAAGSGTRMGVGSKGEIDQSARLSAQINQNAINESTVNKAVQYNNIASQSLMEEANYQAQAVIADGQAEAVKIINKSLNPWEQGLIAFGSSLMSSFSGGGSLGGMFGGGSSGGLGGLSGVSGGAKGSKGLM